MRTYTHALIDGLFHELSADILTDSHTVPYTVMNGLINKQSIDTHVPRTSGL